MSRPEAADLIAQANAARGSDWPAAAGHAAELVGRFPDDPAGYRIGLAAARALRRFDDADDLLARAATRFGDRPWLAVEAVRLAQARGDTHAAIRLAEQLRRTHPETPEGYTIGAALSRDAGFLAVASDIVAEAAMRFPHAAWPVAEAAWTAAASGDTATMVRLASDLRERFPDDPSGYRIGCTAARAARRFDEAAAILAEARTRFATERWMLVEAVWTARGRGAVDEAIAITADLRLRFPDDPVGYQLGAALLAARHRLAEGQAVLLEAVGRFPDAAWPAAERAALARQADNHARGERLVRLLREADLGALIADRDAAPAAGSVVVVLGMHRAGTSLCARLVQRLGVDLGGPLMEAGFDNPDGFQEHKGIVEQHQRLLRALDAGWNTIRAVQPVPAGFWHSPAAADAMEALRHIVTGQLRAAGGAWAFKDPRTIRFLPLWTRLFDTLGVRPRWVLAVRSPAPVVASLVARDAMPPAIAELLWLEHYLDALRHLGPRLAGIVHYERWFTAPDTQLGSLAAMIGLPVQPDPGLVTQSIRTELRHDRADPDAAILPMTRAVHAWLLNDTPDLVQLQRQAETLYHSLEALGRGLPAADGQPAA
jgi:hypothetical protein